MEAGARRSRFGQELAEPELSGLLPKQTPRDFPLEEILTGLLRQAPRDFPLEEILTGLLPHAVPRALPCPCSPGLTGRNVAKREASGAQH